MGLSKHLAALFLLSVLMPLSGAEKIFSWTFETPDGRPDTPGTAFTGKYRGIPVDSKVSGKALKVGVDPAGKKILSSAVRLPRSFGQNAGSVTFRVQPEDWNGNQKDFRNFIDLTNHAGERLSIYRLHNSDGVFIVTLMGKNGQRADAGFKMSDWKKKQWYHLAVTWDQKFITIYQNGQMMRKSPVKNFRFRAPFTSLETGRFIKTRKGGYMLMDDIFLYDQVLTRSEAQNITLPPSPNVLSNGFIRLELDPAKGGFLLDIPNSGRKISNKGKPLFSFRLYDENARKANDKPLNGKGKFWGTALVMNGREITQDQCQFISLKKTSAHQAELTYRHPAAEVKIFFEVTEWGVKQSALLTNTGKDPIYEFQTFPAVLPQLPGETVIVPFPPRIGLEFSKIRSYSWAMNYTWDGFVIRKKSGHFLAFDRYQDIEKSFLPGWGKLEATSKAGELLFTGKTVLFARPGESRPAIANSIRCFDTLNDWADHYRRLNYPQGIKKLTEKLTKKEFDKLSRAYLAPTWATIKGASSIVDRAPGIYIVHPPIYMHHCKGQRTNWDAFPNYFPPIKRVGTMAEFEALIKKVVRNGSFFMPRTSFYYWGTGSDFDLAYGLEKNAIVRIDGKPRTAMWAQPGYMVSPSSRQVLKYLDEIYAKWRRLGTNAYFTNVIGAQLPDHNSFDFHPDAPQPDMFYSRLFALHKKYGEKLPLFSEDGAFWSMPYQVAICGPNLWLSPVPGNLGPKGILARPAPEFALALMHEYIRFYTSNTNFLHAANSPRALAASLVWGTGLKAAFTNEVEMTPEKRRWMRATALIASEIHHLNYGQRLNAYTEKNGIITAIYGKNLNLANYSGKPLAYTAAGLKTVIAENGFLFLSEDRNRIAGFFKEFAGNRFAEPVLLVLIREGERARVYAPVALKAIPLELDGVKAVIPAYPAVIAKKIPGICIDFAQKTFSADPVVPDTAKFPRLGSTAVQKQAPPPANSQICLTWQSGEKLPRPLQAWEKYLSPKGLKITQPLSFELENAAGKISVELGIVFNRYPEEPRSDFLPLLQSGKHFKLLFKTYNGRLLFSGGKVPETDSWGMAIEVARYNTVQLLLDGKNQQLVFNKARYSRPNTHLFPAGKSRWVLGFPGCDLTIHSIRISTLTK